MSIRPQHIADPLIKQGCNPARVVIGGSDHASGVLRNHAGKASMPSRSNCTSYRLKYQSALGRHLLHVAAPSNSRASTCK